MVVSDRPQAHLDRPRRCMGMGAELGPGEARLMISAVLLGIPDLGWVAWIAISLAFAIDAGIILIGWHHTEHYRKPRWERRAEVLRQQAEPIDFVKARRVRDKTRRGPAPLEHHHGKKRVGL